MPVAPFLEARLGKKIGYEFSLKNVICFDVYLFISLYFVKTYIKKLVEYYKFFATKTRKKAGLFNEGPESS